MADEKPMKKWVVVMAKPHRAELEARTEVEAAHLAEQGNPGFLVVDVQRVIEDGIRVLVKDGSQKAVLGYGTVVGRATVWFAEVPGRGILSRRDAEKEIVPDELPAGSVIRKAENNVKIKMDNGETFYGCQVWWAPADEAKTDDSPPSAEEGIQPPEVSGLQE